MLAVVPERPNSRASDFIKPMTPARAAATIGEPGFADARGIADHADDAAVLAGFEMRRGGVAAVDRAIEAGVDLAMPVVRRCFDEALALGEPGIVDQDIEAAEIFDDVIDHRLHGGEVGDVGLVGFGLAAFRGDLADQSVRFVARTAVIDGDARALGGEAQRDLAADAAGRARHQGDFAFQS